MQLSAGEYAELIEAVAKGATATEKDHRRAPRVTHKGRVEIVPYTDDGPGKSMIVSVKNFSPRGICILTPAALQRGRVFVARLPRGNGVVTLLYSVIHCESLGTRQFRIGAELTCVLRAAERTHTEPVAAAALPPDIEHIRRSVLD